MAYGCRIMKLTFEVPDALGATFRKSIPAGERGRVIAQFMAREVRRREKSVIDACQQANRNRRLAKEMKEWEEFDDTDA
jgi:mRNA degradation ribonuclease J1/J2